MKLLFALSALLIAAAGTTVAHAEEYWTSSTQGYSARYSSSGADFNSVFCGKSKNLTKAHEYVVFLRLSDFMRVKGAAQAQKLPKKSDMVPFSRPVYDATLSKFTSCKYHPATKESYAGDFASVQACAAIVAAQTCPKH